MTKNHTKKALLTSVLALVLCFAMLLGTTFAWFTDTAQTKVNGIQAGTLDIELLAADGTTSLDGKQLSWQKASGHESEAVLWEPGATYSLQPITIKNNGNLALKYKVVISGINGDAKLNEVIDWTIDGVTVNEDHSLAANASTTLTIKGTMKTTAGNAYQGLTIDGVAITVYATQDTVEYDSTTNQYDKDAEYSTVDAKTTAFLLTSGSQTISVDNLTINSDETGANSDVIRVTGGNHTISGGSYTAFGTKSNSCLRVDGGTVTITGGTFDVKEDNNCIYAAGGNIIIEGGSFKCEKEYAGHYWVLNCKDNSGSVITVKGGSFYKFDPSNANTGNGEIVVADGYKVVQDGDWYKVVPNT